MVEMRSVMRVVSSGSGYGRRMGVNGAGTGAGVRTEDFLLVYALDDVVVRVARRERRLEGVAEVVVAGDQVVEEARAAVVASPCRCVAAPGRQIGGVEDRRVRVVLVVHGGDVCWSPGGVAWRERQVQSLAAPCSRKSSAWHPSSVIDAGRTRRAAAAAIGRRSRAAGSRARLPLAIVSQ
jgi:hypothetical protein